MQRPTRRISSPIDIEGLHPEIQALFKGVAFYNDGQLTVAYREPVILRNVVVDGESLFHSTISHVIPPGAHVRFELQAVWDDMKAKGWPLR